MQILAPKFWLQDFFFPKEHALLRQRIYEKITPCLCYVGVSILKYSKQRSEIDYVGAPPN